MCFARLSSRGVFGGIVLASLLAGACLSAGAQAGAADPGAAEGNTAPLPAGDDATPAMGVDGESTKATTQTGAAQPDGDAQLFQSKCIGCHTIGGGALSGPDLKPVSAWPRSDLESAISRMEKNVGPLNSEELSRLADFLLHPDAAERLAREQERVAMQQAATLKPPSPAQGRKLFWGEERFANGGVACNACHTAAGNGGNLAISLADAGTRLGKTSLMSTIETPGFPIMRAIYQQHPVTKQEATHVAAFLEEVSQQPAREAGVIPLHAIGLVGALAFMAGVGWIYRRRPAGTRARLVAASRSKTRRGAE